MIYVLIVLPSTLSIEIKIYKRYKLKDMSTLSFALPAIIEYCQK